MTPRLDDISARLASGRHAIEYLRAAVGLTDIKITREIEQITGRKVDRSVVNKMFNYGNHERVTPTESRPSMQATYAALERVYDKHRSKRAREVAIHSLQLVDKTNKNKRPHTGPVDADDDGDAARWKDLAMLKAWEAANDPEGFLLNFGGFVEDAVYADPNSRLRRISNVMAYGQGAVDGATCLPLRLVIKTEERFDRLYEAAHALNEVTKYDRNEKIMNFIDASYHYAKSYCAMRQGMLEKVRHCSTELFTAITQNPTAEKGVPQNAMLLADDLLRQCAVGFAEIGQELARRLLTLKAHTWFDEAKHEAHREGKKHGGIDALEMFWKSVKE